MAEAAVPLHSTVLARAADGDEFGPAYWGRNLRQPVRFAETVGGLLGGGARCFVELGPHPVLTPAVQQTAQASPAAGGDVVTLSFGQRDAPEQFAALALVAGLWAAGHIPDWPQLLARGEGASKLPSYPWQRETFWVRQARTPARQRAAGAEVPPVPAARRPWLHRLHWQPLERPVAAATPSPDQWLLVAPRADEGAALAAALQDQGVLARCVALSQAEAALREAGAATARRVLMCVADERDAAFEPVALMQAMRRAPLAAGTRLWLVTTGAVATSPAGNGQRVAVHAATAWGVGRVVAEEHPELWGGLVDLDPASDLATRAAQLAAELGAVAPGAASAEPQVAWRGTQRLGLRLIPLAEGEGELDAEPAVWRADAATLVTGGLGAVGLRIAAAMVAQGARRLVLLGRSGLPPREAWADAGAHDATTAARIAAVRALEAQGASLHFLQADVADFTSLQQALAGYAAQCFPPIRGVVHAAGLTANRLLADMDRATFERVLAPKLDGALNLERLLPELEAFIGFSSMAGVLGLPGMGNYAAANVALDALADDRRSRGLPSLSIQWGAWSGLGMVSGEAAAFNTDVMRGHGVQTFDADAGAALFTALGGRAEATLLVMPTDWPTLLAARRGRNLALFAEYARAFDAAAAAGGPTLAERLPALPHAERLKLLTPLVREAIGRVLKLAPQRIDAARPLGQMGLNSLMAMELRNRLEALLGRALSATLAWNYPTVQALVGFLAGDAPVAGPTPAAAGGAAAAGAPPRFGAPREVGAPAGTAVAAQMAPEVAAEVAEVAAMSDEEAARLLRRRR